MYKLQIAFEKLILIWINIYRLTTNNLFYFINASLFCSVMCLLLLKLHLQLFKWMQENNKIDVSSYSHYMRFMANNLDAAEMLQLYHNIQDESARKNTLVCNSVLGCLIKKGKFDSGMKLFQQMQLDGLVPDLVTYSTVCHFILYLISRFPYICENEFFLLNSACLKL